MKKCSSCQIDLDKNFLFCPFCGKELSKEKTEPPSCVGAGEEISVFWDANKECLAAADYQKILSRFLELRSKAVSDASGKDMKWSVSADSISLYDAYEHWVGHDDTSFTSIRLTLSRENMSTEGLVKEECDWPCKEQYLLFDKSFREDPYSWCYKHVTHKAWLLIEPYALPGTWRFEYEECHSR